MSDGHLLANRIMRAQTVTQAGLTEDQVIAVLRGLADYTLWGWAFPWQDKDVDRALLASRFCHAIADDIIDRHFTQGDTDE